MNLPSRIDLANQTEDEFRYHIAGKIHSPEFRIWFDVLQNAAENAKSGDQLHINSYESACTAMARYLGLAPEQPKDEDDKPVGRMKCVKCDLIKTGDVCQCGGTEFKVVEDGEHVWLGGKK